MKPLVLALSVLLPVFLHAEKPLPDAEKVRVHFISGSNEYLSEDSLKAYQAFLEKNFPVTVTVSWVKDGAKDLPEADSIAEADVLLVFARRLKLPDDQMKKVRAHWEAEKGVVGIRTASHAFSDDDNEIFDRKIMGGNYDGHFGDEEVEVKNTDVEHPATKNIAPFSSVKLYKAKELAPSAITLQTGTITAKDGKTATHPVTWTNPYTENGRSFYTSLGTPSDFENENFLQMLTQAIFWTAHLEVPKFQKPATAN